MKDVKVYFNQILDSVAKIESYVVGISKEQFLKDQKTQSAVIIQLMLIGEVSKKIDPQIRNVIDLPWKDIAGFRDKAIHHYFDMDLDLIWGTVKDDMPDLKKKIEEYLK